MHGSDFTRYCGDAFDWLAAEGDAVPKMMTVGLHARIIGRAGRIAGRHQILAHVTGTGAAWVARRDAIARVWLDQGL